MGASISLRVLGLAAIVEGLSLVVLLANLFTVHLEQLSSVVGPVHGTAYLVVIASALLLRGASAGTKLLALVPGVGGALALRRARRTGEPPSVRRG